MSNPIPRRLLQHSVALYPYTGTVNGEDQFSTVVNLTHVYIEPIKQNAMTSLGDMKNDSFKLWFDRVNSEPSGTTFKAKDKIVYSDIDCRIREALPIKPATSDILHHWEVNLI